MKNIFLATICCFSLTMGAQDTSKYELARLIKTRVMLKDTTTVNTVLNRYGATDPVASYIADSYLNFLELGYFSEFKENIAKLSESKEALVFSDGNLKKRLNAKEIKESVYVTEDKQKVVKASTKTDNISAIDFYESWNYNEKNNMIEKEVLAYQILIDKIDVTTGQKLGYQQLFMIVKDEEARKKLVLLYFHN
jgi:hypothetical protein